LCRMWHCRSHLALCHLTRCALFHSRLTWCGTSLRCRNAVVLRCRWTSSCRLLVNLVHEQEEVTSPAAFRRSMVDTWREISFRTFFSLIVAPLTSISVFFWGLRFSIRWLAQVQISDFLFFRKPQVLKNLLYVSLLLEIVFSWDQWNCGWCVLTYLATILYSSFMKRIRSSRVRSSSMYTRWMVSL
jgi:hypothetical protein